MFRNDRDHITSLDLSEPRPAKAEPDPDNVPDANRDVLQRAPGQEEINRRARGYLDAGRYPEAFFYLGDAGGGNVTLLVPRPDLRTVLLFTSRFPARDYLRATKTSAEMIELRPESLPHTAASWKAAGINSFAVNRCPRCNFVHPFSAKDNLISREQLLLLWATDRAIRDWRAEFLIGQFLAAGDGDEVARKRATLEFLRDHVDCAVPYVHWLIALIAGTQGDESARIEATARLEEFGPGFMGKTLPCTSQDEMGVWMKSMAEAQMGLLNAFGMLKGPQSKVC